MKLREVFLVASACSLMGLAGAVRAGDPIRSVDLADGGFESSTADGTFPDSGSWKPAWLGESGAVCTLTAGRTGHGLWAYTGRGGADSWSGAYHEMPASMGKVYRAVAWVRTPEGQPWVEGSKAQIQVRFLNAAGTMLLQVSSEPLSTPGTEWQRHAVVTCPAPKGTKRIQLVCWLSKPDGKTGQSVANFDDCWLGEAPAVDRGSN